MADHVWLRNNRRIAAWSLLAPGLGVAVVSAAAVFLPSSGAWWWLKVAALIAAALGLLTLLVRISLLRRPRLSCDGEHLLVDTGQPKLTAVPLEVVECFLLGQGPAFLPGRKLAEAETTTVVVRLAEKAEAWKRGRIHPYIGSWCDGYIILRGTFCEPLSVDVVQRLNRLLGESHRALRQRESARSPHERTSGRASGPCGQTSTLDQPGTAPTNAAPTNAGPTNAGPADKGPANEDTSCCDGPGGTDRGTSSPCGFRP